MKNDISKNPNEYNKFKGINIRISNDRIDDKIRTFYNSLNLMNKVLNIDPLELVKNEEKKEIYKKNTRRRISCLNDKSGPYKDLDSIHNQINLIKNVLVDDTKMDFIEKKKKQDKLHKEMDLKYKRRKAMKDDENKDILAINAKYSLKIVNNKNMHITPRLNEYEIMVEKKRIMTSSLPMKPKNTILLSADKKNQKSRPLTRNRSMNIISDNFNKTTYDTSKMNSIYNDLQKQCNQTVSSSNLIKNKINIIIPKLNKKLNIKGRNYENYLSRDVMGELIKDTKEYKKAKRYFIYPQGEKTPICISENPNNILTKTHFTDKISSTSAFNIRDIINDRYKVRLVKEDILGFDDEIYDFSKRENFMATYSEKKLYENFNKIKEFMFHTQMNYAKIKKKLDIAS